MHLLRQYVVWLARAWPVLVIALLVGVYLLALCIFPAQGVFINKITSLGMQVVGGLIVLQAVNDNLGLFLSKSLGTIVFAWFRDCPLFKLFKRKNGLALIAAGTNSSTGSASLSSVERTANTLEERVSLIESHIRKLREEITVTNYELHQKIDVAKSELIQSISSNQSALGQLADKIESATVGGFKQQAFGVLLAISGTVISFFAQA